MTVTVITGAASGMGRLCVESLRGTADDLVAVDLHAPEIEGTVGVACDISDPVAVADLVTRVTALGSFRTLAHAAGVSPTMTHARRVLDIDLVGTALLRRLRALGGTWFGRGVLLVQCGVVALRGVDPELQSLVSAPRATGFLDAAAARFTDSGLAYAWAKRGVIAVAAEAAVAWGRRGGRVNSLAPGLIDTPMGRQEAERQPMMELMLEKTPLERLGQPGEVATVVAFLLSEGASFISGIDILVDGGMLQGLRAAFLR
jgi:NAD(P)-dependent dehydrogenase (short-subunit alcohol dehydrogenase family)